MTVWAVMMVKDEADVIGGVVRHLASEGVTGIGILDNGSTDGTRDAIDAVDVDCEVVVRDDPEVGYYQSRKISSFLEGLAPDGWVLPVDADELWHADIHLDEFFATVPDDVAVVSAGLLSHFATAADDPAEPDVFRRLRWRTPDVAPLPKVAFRWRPGAVVHQGNHGVSLPGGGGVLAETALTVRHFPYRSADQFVRKARNGAAAYAATDLPDGMGNHWRSYGQILDRHGEEALVDVYREHFWFRSPVDDDLVEDPAPYCR